MSSSQAGLSINSVAGSSTACYIGSSSSDFEDNCRVDPHMATGYSLTGSGHGMIANRLSWFYDFHGPSITIDTACSSSLTAIHVGCQSLRWREAKMVTNASLFRQGNLY
jgi:polyketide synthase 13